MSGSNLTARNPQVALRDATNRVNQPPVRSAPASASKPRRSMPDFVDDEIRDAWLAQKSVDDIYDDIAFDDLRDARQEKNRTTMIWGALMDSGPTSQSRHMHAIKAANHTLQAAHLAGSEGEGEDAVAAYKRNLDYVDTSQMHIDLTCDQVRARINRVVESGVMKKGEFCKAIGLSNAAVDAFLAKRHVMEGDKSEVYVSAWDWFKKRELAGLKMPDAKAKGKPDAANKRRKT
ncbi:Uu.00g016160.m01.CDS01 [Anthostomella pinea]|uniref:Uu.00g016160.m01.CDS01 n=1 Tax=Anthostomella pinea TaxID=933095 RepID=A0AAI8VYP3_9PEZI|nr:Uu.00g016160.m01.CDS01 [Anthostomella pinea]